MNRLLHTVQSLLRGEVEAPQLASGSTTAWGTALASAAFLCGALYGLCMSLYGVIRGVDYGFEHVVAVMLKVPALFLLTLLVAAPSLCVFAMLARTGQRFRQTTRLLLAGATLSLIVLASFGPITAFFTFSTKSHPFMQALNITLFAIAGLIGVGYFARNLRPSETSSNSRSPVRSDGLLRVWFVLYAAVGLQMSWLLRPFIGAPGESSALFRETEGNIFEGIRDVLRYL